MLKETLARRIGRGGNASRGPQLFGGIPAYVLICQLCGFMWLHSVKARRGD